MGELCCATGAPAPAQPARPGQRGRGVGPPPQLRRDRPVPAEPELVLHLAEHLDVPLRERNALLLAAGYAPRTRETSLDAEEMAPVRAALDTILAGHEPFPAVVVDRRWDLVTANASAFAAHGGRVAPPAARAAGERPARQPAPRRAGAPDRQLRRVRRAPGRPAAAEAELYGDPAWPSCTTSCSATRAWRARSRRPDPRASCSCRWCCAGDGGLSFFSTLATFGTARDVTVEELSIESFFPADPATAAALRPAGADGRRAA